MLAKVQIQSPSIHRAPGLLAHWSNAGFCCVGDQLPVLDDKEWPDAGEFLKPLTAPVVAGLPFKGEDYPDYGDGWVLGM